ncbi:PREDICTED: uncharacterized protein LOC107336415 [Acropora digitifera]|uniref:uncharacterized protein LOC107336415 n=1 Tax=Acropora digitifera TaxID=70779 RepID=UPI00077AE7D8|nr:PREDICTED: uncharacterized protein LOC107336415 [Acropora digitifera]
MATRPQDSCSLRSNSLLSGNPLLSEYFQNDGETVPNQIQETHDHTSSTQWRWIESMKNPADKASCELKAQELQQYHWIVGPAFLRSKGNKWPATNSEGSTFDIAHNNPQVKKYIVRATITSPVFDIEERIRNFSEWYRVKKAIALCT